MEILPVSEAPILATHRTMNKVTELSHPKESHEDYECRNPPTFYISAPGSFKLRMESGLRQRRVRDDEDPR
jgi:hypothetical protein